MIFKCVRKDGTLGVPLRIFFEWGNFHLEGRIVNNYYSYLDTDEYSTTFQQAILFFKDRNTPGENLNWDTIEFYKHGTL